MAFPVREGSRAKVSSAMVSTKVSTREAVLWAEVSAPVSALVSAETTKRTTKEPQSSDHCQGRGQGTHGGGTQDRCAGGRPDVQRPTARGSERLLTVRHDLRGLSKAKRIRSRGIGAAIGASARSTALQ